MELQSKTRKTDLWLPRLTHKPLFPIIALFKSEFYSLKASKGIHLIFSESERGLGQQSVDRLVLRKPRLVGGA